MNKSFKPFCVFKNEYVRVTLYKLSKTNRRLLQSGIRAKCSKCKKVHNLEVDQSHAEFLAGPP